MAPALLVLPAIDSTAELSVGLGPQINRSSDVLIWRCSGMFD
jgi:hypothetical protein